MRAPAEFKITILRQKAPAHDLNNVRNFFSEITRLFYSRKKYMSIWKS